MILEISREDILSGLMRQHQSFFPVSNSENIPDYSIVFEGSPGLIIKSRINK